MVLRKSKEFIGLLYPLSFFTFSSESIPTINLSPRDFATLNNSICPGCKISKHPLHHTIFNCNYSFLLNYFRCTYVSKGNTFKDISSFNILTYQ